MKKIIAIAAFSVIGTLGFAQTKSTDVKSNSTNTGAVHSTTTVSPTTTTTTTTTKKKVVKKIDARAVNMNEAPITNTKQKDATEGTKENDENQPK